MGFWTQLYIPLKTGQLYTNTPGILYEKKNFGGYIVCNFGHFSSVFISLAGHFSSLAEQCCAILIILCQNTTTRHRTKIKCKQFIVSKQVTRKRATTGTRHR